MFYSFFLLLFSKFRLSSLSAIFVEHLFHITYLGTLHIFRYLLSIADFEFPPSLSAQGTVLQVHHIYSYRKKLSFPLLTREAPRIQKGLLQEHGQTTLFRLNILSLFASSPPRGFSVDERPSFLFEDPDILFQQMLTNYPGHFRNISLPIPISYHSPVLQSIFGQLKATPKFSNICCISQDA